MVCAMLEKGQSRGCNSRPESLVRWIVLLNRSRVCTVGREYPLSGRRTSCHPAASRKDILMPSPSVRGHMDKRERPPTKRLDVQRELILNFHEIVDLKAAGDPALSAADDKARHDT